MSTRAAFLRLTSSQEEVTTLPYLTYIPTFRMLMSMYTMYDYDDDMLDDIVVYPDNIETLSNHSDMCMHVIESEYVRYAPVVLYGMVR
eukprot:6211279-Pleurochrysis_carterae.AAC.8